MSGRYGYWSEPDWDDDEPDGYDYYEEISALDELMDIHESIVGDASGALEDYHTDAAERALQEPPSDWPERRAPTDPGYIMALDAQAAALASR